MKATIKHDFYVPPVNGRPTKQDHRTPGSDQMLKHILTELGPDFFSNDMKLSPEERARLDWEKFCNLRDAVIWGEVEKARLSAPVRPQPYPTLNCACLLATDSEAATEWGRSIPDRGARYW